MGFFPNIFKISNPFRSLAAISTFGQSELIRAIPGIGGAAAGVLEQIYKGAADFVTAGAASKVVESVQQQRAREKIEAEVKQIQAIGLGGRSAQRLNQLTAGYANAPGLPQAIEETPIMGLDIGGILGTVGGIFGNTGNQIFDVISGSANIASQFFPASQQSLAPVYNPMSVPTVMSATPVSSTLPAVRGSSLTQEIFDAGSKVLGRLGIPFRATTSSFTSVLKRSLSSIASLARRTPAGTIVSILVGLGLTAYEASLLTAWHSQRKRGRRMNPANSKALRRAARRIKSFHKLCVHTDLIKTRSRSSGKSRCGTCRKSPCRC